MLRKKQILPLLMTTTISLLLLSCSSTKNTNSTTTTKDSSPVELTISAAASLKDAMAVLESKFTKNNPNIKLTFNFGASGSLQQPIEQGAPCDIFISAGKSQMTTLKDKGLLIDDTIKDLVRNRLVLIAPKVTALKSLDDLKTDKVKYIAVGEPTSVPAGKYADEALLKLNIKSNIESKLVFAKDVKEVLTWVSTGNADVGFVYFSDTINNDSITIMEILSEDSHSPILYPMSVIKSTKNPRESKLFEDFLFTKEAQDILKEYGYEVINTK